MQGEKVSVRGLHKAGLNLGTMGPPMASRAGKERERESLSDNN